MPISYQTNNFIARDLADWVGRVAFHHLSPSAIACAKLFWLDSLGCAIGGSQTEDARLLLAHHRSLSGCGGGPCSVFVSGFRTNPVDAAFLNSHMVRALDFNDIYWKSDPSHPSDIICGPLALCESLGATGELLIVATVIAYELQCRFAEIGAPGIREYGWHHATLSGFSAALAAGRVLGLSVDQLVNAVGICASRTGTLGAVTAGTLTMMKNTVDPWAARMGVESALLAQRGFTGPAHIIDGKEGLFHAMGHATVGGRACTFDREALTRGLPAGSSDRYRIEGCSMKSVPVEALMHSPLSALMKLQALHRLVPSAIRAIRVEVIARAADILGDPAKYRPKSRETADHSLPYAIAALLVDRALGPAQFEPSRVADPALVPIMDRVRVVASQEFESRFPAAQPSRVTVVMEDGTEHAAEVEYPYGHPANPMPPPAVEEKFRTLATDVIGETACDGLIELVHRLDEVPNVRELSEKMCVGAASQRAHAVS